MSYDSGALPPETYVYDVAGITAAVYYVLKNSFAACN